MKNLSSKKSKTDIYSEQLVLKNTEKALLNILEDYYEEKNNLEKIQQAVLNILEDYSDEKRTVTVINNELVIANKELDAFTYSVSHDLRAPLRAVNGYAQMLKEDFETKLDTEGKRIIDNICFNAVKMGMLIDELLTFSRLGRKKLFMTEVNMNELTKNMLVELSKSVKYNADIKISDLHKVNGDYSLLHQVMFNLVSNAIKYSSKKKYQLIEIFSEEKNNEVIFSVKDNGAGFDMKYYDKLFGVFQRLHRQDEFEGIGVGLAIVQRIISKHGGRVWAEGKIDEGAIFNFSLQRE